MASKTYRTAAQFAREFRRDVNRLADNLTAAYHAENHKEARKLLEAETPQATGELAAGYVDLVEGVRASPDTIRTRKVRPKGTASTIGNRAPHFHAVDFGRRKFKTGRLGGSPDAPRGMTKPAAEKLIGGARQLKLRARAAKHAERGLR